MTQKQLIDMRIHEVITINPRHENPLKIMRVATGWVYFFREAPLFIPLVYR